MHPSANNGGFSGWTNTWRRNSRRQRGSGELSGARNSDIRRIIGRAAVERRGSRRNPGEGAGRALTGELLLRHEPRAKAQQEPAAPPQIALQNLVYRFLGTVQQQDPVNQ